MTEAAAPSRLGVALSAAIARWQPACAGKLPALPLECKLNGPLPYARRSGACIPLHSTLGVGCWTLDVFFLFERVPLPWQ